MYRLSHIGNSTCQDLISWGEFLVLVSAAFFNVAPVYPIENMTLCQEKQTFLLLGTEYHWSCARLGHLFI
jgi:hypothetical protein